ncbi:MAG: DUF2442 domain-containing protein [Bdellovibrio sp.]|nr:MAG: DUF2442 domain-containing protein [Bdellovibrio sp.]
MHEVIQVHPTQEFKVYVYFSDGKIKLFDMKPHLNQGVFKQISDIEVFISKCTIINRTLAWDVGGNFDPYKCIDIAPDTIYETGIEVTDPFAGNAA